MRNADRDTFWLYGIAGAIALALCACGGSDSSPGAPVAGFPSSYNAQANAYETKPINLDDYERVIAEIRNFYGGTVVLPRRPSDDPAS